MIKITAEDGIVLKSLQEEDAGALFTLIRGSVNHLEEWLPWTEHTAHVSDSEQFIARCREQEERNDGFQAGIWHEGTLTGMIGLHRIDWANKSTSIGYWLGKEHEGKGLMTKSCTALLTYCFETVRLNRIEIRVAPGNHRSRAIPERLGFTEEGRLRQAEQVRGRFVDHLVYGMLKEELHQVKKAD